VVGYFISRSWRLPEHVGQVIANHHNAQSIFDEGSTTQIEIRNLLALLKMAEHICGCYRVLGGQEQDHEWDAIASRVLDHVGLSEYDFESLKETILEMGSGRINY